VGGQVQPLDGAHTVDHSVCHGYVIAVPLLEHLSLGAVRNGLTHQWLTPPCVSPRLVVAVGGAPQVLLHYYGSECGSSKDADQEPGTCIGTIWERKKGRPMFKDVGKASRHQPNN
jgi:hypothetical protein